MHKMLIVLLAVCIVSTHAFVKRDAPESTGENYLETIQKKLQDLSKNYNIQLGTFDAEAMKRNIDAMAESVNKAMSELTAKNKAAK